MREILPERMTEWLRLVNKTGLDSRESIEDRLCSLADFAGQHGEALGLMDLNRRYSALLSPFGIKVSTLVLELAESGRILLRYKDNKTWIVSKLIEGMSEDYFKREEFASKWINKAMGVREVTGDQKFDTGESLVPSGSFPSWDKN